jgi:hypothetical protein
MERNIEDQYSVIEVYIAVRKSMTLCAQKLKMRCAHKTDAAAVREAEGHV